jgi:hypothetical protein
MTVRTFTAPVTAAQSAIFFDSFEYVVERNPATLPQNGSAFVTSGGWSYNKAVNLTGSWQGYVYTEFNAARGGRVMVAEVPNASYQTDHYVAYDHGSAMPANVWMRFKMYTDPASNFSANMDDPNITGSKFIYSSIDGGYPVSGGAQLWMGSIGRVNTSHGTNLAPANGSFYLDCASRADGSEAYYSATTGNPTLMCHNVTQMYLPGGTWLEIKLHYDMSGAQGIYEMWARTVGAATWTKYSEWIGGVTPNFVWPLSAARRVGNRAIRTPSDFGRGNNLNPVVPYTKFYWDDFGIYASDPG